MENQKQCLTCNTKTETTTFTFVDDWLEWQIHLCPQCLTSSVHISHTLEPVSSCPSCGNETCILGTIGPCVICNHHNSEKVTFIACKPELHQHIWICNSHLELLKYTNNEALESWVCIICKQDTCTICGKIGHKPEICLKELGFTVDSGNDINSGLNIPISD